MSIWVETGDETFDASATDFKQPSSPDLKPKRGQGFLVAIASLEEDDMEETERLAMEFIGSIRK
ncbi:MAG: hypothetical protein IPP25_09570 [Saprospiraceae bacterium]|nr:hypothetical protein [Candidatus Opimibacter skivensis]